MPARIIHKKIQELSLPLTSAEAFIEITEVKKSVYFSDEVVKAALKELSDLHFVEIKKDKVRLTETGRLAQLVNAG